MSTITNPEDRLSNLLQRLSSIPIMMPPKESPLSMPQAMLVNWVARTPGCGVLDIAKGLNLTPPTVSVGIRKLVKSGWLEQREDPNDRRARPIYLTDKGQAFAAGMKAHRTDMLKQFLSGLTNDEQEQLICLLDRAVTALEAAQVP